MSTLNKAIDGASDAAAAAASSEALSAATDVVADAAEFVVDHASDGAGRKPRTTPLTASPPDRRPTCRALNVSQVSAGWRKVSSSFLSARLL
jgi:hypothetical protein